MRILTTLLFIMSAIAQPVLIVMEDDTSKAILSAFFPSTTF